MLDDGGRPRKYTEKEKDNLLSWGISIKADEWEAKVEVKVATLPPPPENNLADLFAKAGVSSREYHAMQNQKELLERFGRQQVNNWMAQQQAIGVTSVRNGSMFADICNWPAGVNKPW